MLPLAPTHITLKLSAVLFECEVYWRPSWRSIVLVASRVWWGNHLALSLPFITQGLWIWAIFTFLATKKLFCLKLAKIGMSLGGILCPYKPGGAAALFAPLMPLESISGAVQKNLHS